MQKETGLYYDPKTVAQLPDFDYEFPERFNWGAIDSITISEAAEEMCRHISDGFSTLDRNNVPGLRLALNILAKKAKV